MLSDFAIACRSLTRSPGFTLSAIVTLALGIGANTTMFSVVNAVLLRPLPGYQTDQLVQICRTDRGGCTFLDPEIYLKLVEYITAAAPIAAHQYCRMNLTGLGQPEQLTGPCTTSNWFALQHAIPLIGRTFLPEEDRHNRNHVVILSHGFWQRRFGADPKILGTTLLLDNERWTVVGVMQSDFRPIGSTEAPIYTPYVVRDNPHGLNVTTRLKPGVSLEKLQAELDVQSTRLARENPDWKGLKLVAIPVLTQAVGPQRPLLFLLLGAVSFVLLIACVNAANLMLARSAARQHEMDVRIALGATTLHIAKFVLAEACILSLAAGSFAVVIAIAGLRALSPLTTTLPRADELNIDSNVLLFTFVLGSVSTLLIAALPIFRTGSLTSVAGMRSRATSRSQAALITSEVALAFVLLIGAGLLIRSFLAIRSKDLGFNPQNVLTHFLALPPSSDGTRTAGVAQFARIRERVAALPGVRGVATSSALPMFGVAISMDVHIAGEPEQKRAHEASLAVISDNYFQVMGIPQLSGRGFTPDDREHSTKVAIVSESIGKRYFNDKPNARRMVLPEFLFNIDGGSNKEVEIVGVVGNVCVNSVIDCTSEHIYLPESQNALRMENLVIRSDADPMALEQAVRDAVYAETLNIPLDEAQTLIQRTAYLSDDPKRGMWLLSIFSALALLLAALGIYSVAAYVATQRRQEIGIRMALGADARNIAALLFRGVLLPSIAGLALGVPIALFLARFLQALLVGVSMQNPVNLAVPAAALLFLAIISAAGPSLRAASAAPAQVLRRD